MPARLRIDPGTRYGLLVVLCEVPAKNLDQRQGSPLRRLRLRCDCGTTMDSDLHALRKGVTKSCGCKRIAQCRELGHATTRHGFTRRGAYHPLYRVGSTMNERCHNPNSWKFKDYGARGIYVCDEWLNDRAAFVRWGIANGWEKGLQIDRRDNDGPYSPENCHFVTPKQNSANRRPALR